MTKYFFNNNHSNFLEILDGKRGRDYYTGVTLEYIEKYVLHMKFTRSEIVNYILRHHSNGNLKSLYCGDVKNVVIHRIRHQNNYNKENSFAYSERGEYKYFINHLNKFKNGE